MPGPEVMLATRSQDSPARTIERLTREGWHFQLKLDGIRAVVIRTRDTVQITNRRQLDITARYPDIVEAVVAGGRWTGIVDGEIVVTDSAGRPDFELAHLRDAQSTPAKINRLAARHPATFMPFDVLEARGRDVRAEPWMRRMTRLAALWPTPPMLSNPDGATMWQFVLENQLEGLVAKRPDAAYRPGRQKAWVKIKATRRLSALVSGVVPGEGSRGAVGALELSLWDVEAARLVPIGSVGSGMRDADLRSLPTRLDAGPVVVEVEYLEVSSDGQLRQPVFRGYRSDIDPLDCVVTLLV